MRHPFGFVPEASRSSVFFFFDEKKKLRLNGVTLLEVIGIYDFCYKY